MRVLLSSLLCVLLCVACGSPHYSNDATSVDSLYQRGRHFLQVHYYDSAFTCFAAAEKIFDSATPLRIQGKVYANLSSLYKDASIYEQSLDYATRSLHAYEALGDTACVLLSWMDMADVYTKMDVEDKYEQAQYCYDKALSFFTSYSNDSIQGRIYQEKGMKYVVAHQLDSGLHYLLQSIALPAQGNSLSIRYLYLGLAYHQLGREEEAKGCVLQALTLPNGLRQRSGCYNVLLDIARAENDTTAIHHYANILVNYKDSILHIENQTARRIVELNNTTQQIIQRQHTKRLIIGAVVLLILVAVVVCLVGFIRRKRQQSHEEKLNRMVDSLQEKLVKEQQKKELDRHALELQLNTLKQALEDCGIKPFEKWKDLKTEATQRYFYTIMDRLYVSFPFLTERELQMCLLVLLRMSNDEMARVLFISPNSVSKTKQRLAQRLGTTPPQLRDYLLQYTF